MRISVLGPLRVWDGQEWRPITAPKERAVLALLVAEAGRFVTTGSLVAQLWDDADPKRANVLQTYVYRLRRVLEPGRQGADCHVLRYEPQGYLLDLVSIDCLIFERLAGRGIALLEAGDPVGADDVLSEALELWQSDEAFSDVRDVERVQRRADELMALRDVVQRAWIRARIECGRADSVLAAIADLRVRAPEDEELILLRMLALHGVGRTNEALALYAGTAQRLRAETGGYPGQQLRDAHQRLLQVDEVAPPERDVSVPVRAGRSRKQLVLAVSATVLILVAALVAFRPEGSSGELRAAAPSAGIHRQFDLVVFPGKVYDLDVAPGTDPNEPLSPQTAARGDLYRPKDAEDQLGGWSMDNIHYNTFLPVAGDAAPEACRLLPKGAGGSEELAGYLPNDRFCAETTEGRWALISIRTLPAKRQSSMQLHLTVLDPVGG